MAPQLLLGLLLLIAFLIFARWYTNINPARLAQGIRAFVVAFGALAGTGLLFAGRVGLALITIAAVVAAVRAMRHGPGGAFSGGGGHADPGRISEITTDTLRMSLDHATGELDGEVLRGPYQGRTLGSLGLGDLFELIERCRREDPQSVPLLETYLDRREPDWRGEATGRGGGGGGAAGEGGAGGRGGAAGPGANGMDEAQALEILGLQPGATPEEIKAAHRRLMARFHPDHGGSTYLAAQINRAKDHLLRRGR